jgi:pilus assembly protein Flp/PilA
MGPSAGACVLSDAGGGYSARSHAARSALKFWRNEFGATAIEYALIAGFISIVIVTAVTQIGGTVQSFFAAIAPYV